MKPAISSLQPANNYVAFPQVFEHIVSSMKRAILTGIVAFGLALPGARGQDEPVVAPEKTACVIVMINDFNGARTFSTVTPAEMIALKKGLPGQNEAARKAYGRVKRAWYEKHTPPPQPPQAPQTQKPPTTPTPAGATVVDLRTAATSEKERPKTPPFPLKLLPVKEVRELETCATEEAATERVKFYENREIELKKKTGADNPFGSTAFAGAGSSSGFAPAKTEKKPSATKTPEVDPAVLEEVKQQFLAEIEKVLAGIPEETTKPASKGPIKKEGLGTGVGNTFKATSFGSKK